MSADPIFTYLLEQVAGLGFAAVEYQCRQFLKRGKRAGVEPTKRKAIPKDWIIAAWLRQDMICPRCEFAIRSSELSGDHFIPLIEGGKHSERNIRAVHRDCNSSKGAKLPLAESKRTGQTIKEQIRGME